MSDELCVLLLERGVGRVVASESGEMTMLRRGLDSLTTLWNGVLRGEGSRAI